MTLVIAIIVSILQLYLLILIARFVIETIHSFSRNFRAPSWFMRIAEFCFVVTDPPVKALRKIIPPVRAGGVMIDVSSLVLLIGLQLLIQLLARFFM